MNINMRGFHTLVLAGGGNRCWWQAGALQTLADKGWTLPQRLSGTSAGAAIAFAAATQRIDQALQACRDVYQRQSSVLRRVQWWRGRIEFAHQTVYPAWLQRFVDGQAWRDWVASGRSLHIGLTRPASWSGLHGSVFLATLAYVLDKKFGRSIHPRLPRWLGLRMDMPDAADLSTRADLVTLLRAAAAAPPFMSAVQVHHRWSLDGGYFDNAPVPPMGSDSPAGALVMLTRHYPGRDTLFTHQGRQYWQPSQPVPVSTWDCTPKATIDEAFQLGRRDALALVERARIRL